MDNYNQQTIPVLIDVLTNYLKNLSDKISSFSPILDNIQSTLGKNSQDIHDLKTQIDNLKNAFDSIKEIEKDIDRLKQITNEITTINKKIDTAQSSLDNMSKKVSPIAKLSEMIATPAGTAIFIVAAIGAIAAVIKILSHFGII